MENIIMKKLIFRRNHRLIRCWVSVIIVPSHTHTNEHDHATEGHNHEAEGVPIILMKAEWGGEHKPWKRPMDRNEVCRSAQ